MKWTTSWAQRDVELVVCVRQLLRSPPYGRRRSDSRSRAAATNWGDGSTAETFRTTATSSAVNAPGPQPTSTDTPSLLHASEVGHVRPQLDRVAAHEAVVGVRGGGEEAHGEKRQMFCVRVLCPSSPRARHRSPVPAQAAKPSGRPLCPRAHARQVGAPGAVVYVGTPTATRSGVAGFAPTSAHTSTMQAADHYRIAACPRRSCRSSCSNSKREGSSASTTRSSGSPASSDGAAISLAG